MVVLAAALARRPAADRHAGAALGLLLATLVAIATALALGAAPPLADAARGLAAAAAWWLLLGLAAAWAFRPRAMLLAAGIAALLVPGTMRLWQWATLRPDPAPATRPPVTVLTGLPLFWGDDRERAALPILARRLALSPIDGIDPRRFGTVLLLAQPHAPGPAGLVAIDGWVRRGGRVLILTDPALRWAEQRRPDDPLAPPADDGLAPLLAHWGLRVVAGPGHGIVPVDLGRRRLLLLDPGRFVATGGACRLLADARIAECAIGRGRALLLADADLLHGDTWVGAAPGRAHRVADNVVAVIDMVEQLAGVRDHAARIDWASRPTR